MIYDLICILWKEKDLTDILIFVGFVAFGAVIQIPGIGGGVQVVTVIVLTELFSLNFETSSGLAILIWAITFVVIAIVSQNL